MIRQFTRWGLAVALAIATTATAAETAPDVNRARGRQGMVVSVSADASDAGVQILQEGGNAVDAAIATAFALAVTFPSAGNIGGGGFMLYVPVGGSPPAFVNFREVAPGAATRDMFVDPAQRTPHRHVGVPGTVRGLALAHEKFGSLPWERLVAPAVRLAREGFQLDAYNARTINALLQDSDLQRFAELHRVFGRPDGKPWQVGDRLVQPDLAASLERIASQGADGFYLGPTAELLVNEMRLGGGLISADDLKNYQAELRTPIQGKYRGYTIVSSPPPSSGGTILIEMLNILENFDLASRPRYSAENTHLLVEAMRRAYRDRAANLGDPNFVSIPSQLTSKEHARQWAATIDRLRATRSRDLAEDIPIAGESDHTTHFSVVDSKRNCVSLTYTLQASYGSRVVVRGGGFLLNDEMTDFNPVPGVTNTRGQIGTLPNQIAPGKRMLSSMTPTVVLHEGKPVLVTGSPGGRTIINTVLNVVLNVIDFKMEVGEAVDAPRIHHQWFPDVVRYEAALDRSEPALIERLQAMGHEVGRVGKQGDAHSIYIDWKTGELVGAADRRASGKAAGY
jgi:gamma-glutamyltranspeptidase/glutathione hydrolase